MSRFMDRLWAEVGVEQLPTGHRVIIEQRLVGTRLEVRLLLVTRWRLDLRVRAWRLRTLARSAARRDSTRSHPARDSTR